jgi:predicted amidophosphoribosyltransferase
MEAKPRRGYNATRTAQHELFICPECKFGLPDGTRRCPMCGRLLTLPKAAMLVAGVGLVALLGHPGYAVREG